MRVEPIAGGNYSFKQIVEDLDLRDSPSLNVKINGSRRPVQHSHITFSDMLKHTEWAESRWIFVGESSEWIPIFYAAEDLDILPLLNIEFYEEHGHERVWLTPKKFPRKLPEIS